MQEWLPLAGGVTIALFERLIAPLRLRFMLTVALSLLIGTIASFVSGELAVSWGFAIVDTILVLLAWALTRAVFVLWSLRVRRHSSYGSRPRRKIGHDLSGD
jgi:hypothetical protein